MQKILSGNTGFEITLDKQVGLCQNTIRKRKEKKKMLENLMDEVIKRFGFESDEAIMFCNCCESLEHDDDINIIITIYDYLMER